MSAGLEAVRRIIEEKKLDGVYGPLIENLDVDEKFFTALEVTAGGRYGAPQRVVLPLVCRLHVLVMIREYLSMCYHLYDMLCNLSTRISHRLCKCRLVTALSPLESWSLPLVYTILHSVTVASRLPPVRRTLCLDLSSYASLCCALAKP